MLTRAAKSAVRKSWKDRILKPWAGTLSRLDTLKFLCYIDLCPAIIPIIQYQATDSRWLAFSPVAFRPALNDLKRGMPLAVFGLTMAMEDVRLYIYSFQAKCTRKPDEPKWDKIQSTHILHK